MYALAASAAGVSLLALAQPSEAKIIYTHTHQRIQPGHSFRLDHNHDGIIDFTFAYRYRLYTSGAVSSIFGRGYAGNEIEGTAARHGFLAAALKRGTRIPDRHGAKARARMAYICTGPDGCSNGISIRRSGNWLNATDRFLGLKFRIHGKTHYGWARLNIQWVKSWGQFLAMVTGYAYEMIPNRPIIAGKTRGKMNDMEASPDWLSPDDPGPGASLTDPIPDTPQPASLGLLAMGSPAFSIWRRRESVGATQ
jgi:hypothetical protein